MQLDDAFGVGTVDLKGPKLLCNPANKNGEDPSAPAHSEHLVGYEIKQTVPPFAKRPNLVVTNQFGTFVLDARKPNRLFIPSNASAVDSPPIPVAPALDHFKCYTVKGGTFRTSGIVVEDQFGTLTVDVKKPVRLCLPADKNGEGINDPATELVCYKARTTGGTPRFERPGEIFIANQFGPNVFDVRRLRELCVPAVRQP